MPWVQPQKDKKKEKKQSSEQVPSVQSPGKPKPKGDAIYSQGPSEEFACSDWLLPDAVPLGMTSGVYTHPHTSPRTYIVVSVSLLSMLRTQISKLITDVACLDSWLI